MMERKVCSSDAAQQEKRHKKEAHTQPLSEESQKTECWIFSKGAIKQKEAALAREPYEGSQVPEAIISRASKIKSSQVSELPQRPLNQTVLEQPVIPAASIYVVPSGVSSPVKRREEKEKKHHNAEVLDVKKKLYMYQTDKQDKYATIHHASPKHGEVLYEFRMYNFTKLNGAEKRHAKRNCREWKARRRFFDSWKHGDIVLVGLFYPGQKSVRSVPQFLTLSGLALEPRSCFRRSWDDESDTSEKESKQIVLQRNHVKSKRIKTDVARQQASSHLEGKVVISHGASSKTASQKERARKIQQGKRQRKRADLRAERDFSRAHQSQTETSTTTDDKSAQRLRETPTDNETGDSLLETPEESNLQPWIQFLKSLPAQETHTSDSKLPATKNQPADGWRWSSDGGWWKQSVFLDDGSYQTATFWSSSGGYIQEDIIPVTSPDPKSVTSPTPPPEKRRASPSPPKKYGSANLNHTTISAIIKMILEYTFSSDNLFKDRDLRRRMNPEGFVPISYLAGLTRIRRITKEIDIIRSCCEDSSTLEIKEDEDGMEDALIRMKEGWGDWTRFEEALYRKEALERARVEKVRDEEIDRAKQRVIEREILRMKETRIEEILRQEEFLKEAALRAERRDEIAREKSSQKKAAEIKDPRKEAAQMKELQRKESKRAKKVKRRG